MNENKLIRIVLLILFLWLFFVYIVFFNLKRQKDNLGNSISTGTVIINNSNQNTNFKQKNNSWLDVVVFSWDKDTNKFVNSTWSQISNQKSWNQNDLKNSIENTWEDLIPLPWFVNDDSQQWIIDTNQLDVLPNLSGTEAFFGEIEVTKTLWLEYKYILKDKDWIYYVYMWTWVYDYEKNVKLLWWDIFYLRTELDLLKNNLPWDLVMFINIPNITYIKSPKFQRQMVFMVIYFKESQRVLQVPYEVYHKKKKHIKKIFNEIYSQ